MRAPAKGHHPDVAGAAVPSTGRASRIPAWVGSTPVVAAAAAVVSVLIIMAQYVSQDAYPLGGTSHCYLDYCAQYVPFHAMFREFLHGNPAVGAQFNWVVGLGQPSIPDYAVYLGSPWNLLIGLFPLAKVELGMFVIAMFKVATIAAAMVAYLRIVHGKGHPVAAGVLGVAYATSGYILEEGLYNPMWLDGVAALPMIALVGHWARSGKHPVASVLVVAVFWWSNFYSAMMATVGAVVLTVVVALADKVPWRQLRDQLLRFGIRGGLGVGLSLPVVLPAVWAGLNAPELNLTYGPDNVPLATYVTRLFTFSELADYSPGISIGTVLLIAAIAFFAHREIPLREKLVYGTGLVLMIATMATSPARAIWFGGTEPHGSYFRNSFIISAFLLVMAWRFLLRRQPQLLATLIGAGVVLGMLVWIALDPVDPRLRHPWSTEVTLAMVLFTVAVVALATYRPSLQRVVGVLLVVVLLAELTANAIIVDKMRTEFRRPMGAWFNDSARDLPLVEQQRAAGRGWPDYRLDSAMYSYGNQPGNVVEPGLRYYSSEFLDSSADVFRRLGVPSSANGREMGSVEDPGLFALLGITGRLVHPTATTSDVISYPAFPVVRVAAEERPRAEGIPAVLATRDALWDESVHSTPEWTRRPEQSAVEVPAGKTVRVAGRCEVGGKLVIHGLPLKGTVRSQLRGATGKMTMYGLPKAEVVAAPRTLPLGSDGTFDLVFTADGKQGPQDFTLDSFACYDAVAAADQIEAASANPPDITLDGRDVRASWSQPVTGDVIISTTAVEGWSCRVDGRPADLRPRQGLLALPVEGAGEVSCRYTTPLINLGVAAFGVSALGTVGLWWFSRRRTAITPRRSADAG